jgi:hypothetical protein
METINSIATAAAKAVWGDDETNKEPISGAQGDVSKGQPYDAGNLAPEEQEEVKAESTIGRTTEPGATSTSATTGTTGTADSKLATPGANEVPSTNVGAPESVSKPSVVDASATKPSIDSGAAQNDTRAPEDVDDEVELKGPGPRPLATVAKEHGGDAGSSSEASSASPGENLAASGGKETEGISSSNKSENLGDGTQYVKSSGLAADGGDFDVTKPGAGREADRIMDEKGMHHGIEKKAENLGEDKSEGKSSSHRGHTKDKPSLGERIKAKLHKH